MKTFQIRGIRRDHIWRGHPYVEIATSQDKQVGQDISKILLLSLSQFLAKLVNAPLSTGILPDTHKLLTFAWDSRFKKPNLDPGDPSSYRQVSNVSLSKFVERIDFLQLEKYLSSNDLLPSSQSTDTRTFQRDSHSEGKQWCCDCFRQRQSNLSVATGLFSRIWHGGSEHTTNQSEEVIWNYRFTFGMDSIIPH